MLRKLLLLAVVTASLAGSQVPQRRVVSLVVANGIVITVDGNRRVLSRGSVAIEGRDIVAVDTAEVIAAGFRGRETIDAAGAVVMPGLINTHTHAPMVLFRGLADDLALMDWLNKYIFPAEAKTVSPAFVRTGTRLATAPRRPSRSAIRSFCRASSIRTRMRQWSCIAAWPTTWR